MKYVDINYDKLEEMEGRRLKETDTFQFRCHGKLACFNQCCRNLNLFLYPYDVMRLKNALAVTSDVFLDRYVDVVLKEGTHFPHVLLRMMEDQEGACPFLVADGCSVYAERPGTCRTFPMEQGRYYDAAQKRTLPVYFFRPPTFCLGPQEDTIWSPPGWIRDQGASVHSQMTTRWAEFQRMFQTDPWGKEGPQGPRAKMAFMATYNLDRFRDFVLQSSFLQRYKLKPELKKKIRRNDTELLKLGMAWALFIAWGRSSKLFRQR